MHGLLDDELDAANTVRAEAHLQTCQQCAVDYQDFGRLRAAIRPADLRYTASAKFKARWRAALDYEFGAP